MPARSTAIRMHDEQSYGLLDYFSALNPRLETPLGLYVFLWHEEPISFLIGKENLIEEKSFFVHF